MSKYTIKREWSVVCDCFRYYGYIGDKYITESSGNTIEECEKAVQAYAKGEEMKKENAVVKELEL